MRAAWAARKAQAQAAPASYKGAVRGLTAPLRGISRVGRHGGPMNKSRPAQDDAAGNELQPPATGANRGSPAAPVMKQFQKTKSESTGRS